MTPAPRGVFWPAVGIVLLFAVAGPAIGGAVFIPLAMLAEAESQAVLHIGWIAGLIGHAFALIPAYVLGLTPALLTGLAYAIYDAYALSRWPRALAAALIGALGAHLLYLWLVWASAAVGGWIAADFGDDVGDVAFDWTSGEFDASLYHALLASGAISAFACAAAAGLLGLSLRRT